ncbi:hypothetical protein Q5X42_04925 [Acinetobacter baumannii]|nr:hypothetical protein [Acinetobacter baumannii]
MTDLNNPETIEIHGLRTITKLCHFGADNNMEGCTFTEIVERLFAELEKAKAQAVPETHLLIPKEPNRKTIMAMACVCLGSVGSGPEFLTLKEAKDVYSALVEKETGAEG